MQSRYACWYSGSLAPAAAMPWRLASGEAEPRTLVPDEPAVPSLEGVFLTPALPLDVFASLPFDAVPPGTGAGPESEPVVPGWPAEVFASLPPPELEEAPLEVSPPELEGVPLEGTLGELLVPVPLSWPPPPAVLAPDPLGEAAGLDIAVCASLLHASKSA